MLKKLTSFEDIREKFSGLALVIKKIGSTHYHCGILYQTDDGEIFFLHLAADFDLRVESSADGYFWNQVDMPSFHMKFMIALCSAVAEKKPGVPYGINAEGVQFSEDGGISYPEFKGLTCATFVLTLFKVYKYLILDEDTWPENSNQYEQGKIVFALNRFTDMPKERVQANRQFIGCKLFTPEQVVGATYKNYDAWPICFEEAEIGAKRVEREAQVEL